MIEKIVFVKPIFAFALYLTIVLVSLSDPEINNKYTLQEELSQILVILLIYFWCITVLKYLYGKSPHLMKINCNLLKRLFFLSLLFCATYLCMRILAEEGEVALIQNSIIPILKYTIILSVCCMFYTQHLLAKLWVKVEKEKLNLDISENLVFIQLFVLPIFIFFLHRRLKKIREQYI